MRGTKVNTNRTQHLGHEIRVPGANRRTPHRKAESGGNHIATAGRLQLSLQQRRKLINRHEEHQRPSIHPHLARAREEESYALATGQ